MYQLLPDLGIPRVVVPVAVAAVIARTRHAGDGRRTIVYILVASYSSTSIALLFCLLDGGKILKS